MTREVRLSHTTDLLEEFDYPIDRETVAAEVSDVTLLLADGQRNLGDLIGETDSERFDSADEIVSELHNTLPREAVGEPYQSEGEG
jgi:hypothetical protein